MKKPRTKAAPVPRVDARGKKRGGATVACPNCGQPSRVTRTERNGTMVRRERACTAPTCGHRFETHEVETPR